MSSFKKKLIQALMTAVSALPLRVHQANARLVGWIAHRVVRYRLRVGEDTIDKAFPEAAEARRRRWPNPESSVPSTPKRPPDC